MKRQIGNPSARIVGLSVVLLLLRGSSALAKLAPPEDECPDKPGANASVKSESRESKPAAGEDAGENGESAGGLRRRCPPREADEDARDALGDGLKLDGATMRRSPARRGPDSRTGDPRSATNGRLLRFAQAAQLPGHTYDGSSASTVTEGDLVRAPAPLDRRPQNDRDLDECWGSRPRCGARYEEPALPSAELRALPFWSGSVDNTAIRIGAFTREETKTYDPELRKVLLGREPEALKTAAIRALGQRVEEDAVRAFLLENGLSGALRYTTENVMRRYLNNLIPEQSKNRDKILPEIFDLKKDPDMSQFSKKAAAVIKELLKSYLDNRPSYSDLVWTNLNRLTYMNSPQLNEFFKSFDDPVLLAAVLLVHTTLDVGEHEGMHSGPAQALYERFTQLNMGLAEAIAALPESKRAAFVSTANRFHFFDKELEREAKEPNLHSGARLREALPAIMFDTPGLDVHVLYSLFSDSTQGPRGKTFLGELLAAMDAPAKNAAGTDAKRRDIAALLYLHKDRLSTEQRAKVEGALEAHPEAKSFLADYEKYPAIYGSDLWLRSGPKKFYVAMGQPEFLPELESLLRNSGMTRKSQVGRITTYSGTVEGKPYECSIETFDSKGRGGWSNKDAVSQKLLECLTDEIHHGCIYRGHYTNWWNHDPRFASTAFKGKAFFDGGCDSKENRAILALCPECVGWWNTRTAKGEMNAPFFHEGVTMLTRGVSFPSMSARYHQRFSEIEGNFTGHWSSARAFAYATGREVDPLPAPELPGRDLRRARTLLDFNDAHEELAREFRRTMQ